METLQTFWAICVITLQEKKSIFLYSDETMSFHLCPLPPFLSLGISFFIASHQTFIYIDNIHSEVSPDLRVPVLLAFLHVRNSSRPLLSLVSFTTLNPAIHFFIVMEYPELDTASQSSFDQDCEKEKVHLARPADITLGGECLLPLQFVELGDLPLMVNSPNYRFSL